MKIDPRDAHLERDDDYYLEDGTDDAPSWKERRAERWSNEDRDPSDDEIDSVRDR